jgi:hypothetical protein
MGEAEPFPALQEFHVGTVAAGKLRFVNVNETAVTHDDTACVAPFGQTQMIDMFYRGIDPEIEEKLCERMADSVLSAVTKKAKPEQIERVQQSVRKILRDEIVALYREPLMAAVDALPRHDLAAMAEALVSLTAFRRRMTAEQEETVAGPIDVALISKGEGFVWVRRKDPLARSLGIGPLSSAA